MDANPISFADTRPGKDPKYHKQVRTSFDLSVRTEGNLFEVSGNLLFFAVRGDSAAIPAELRARGVGPDSTRWWFERMDDETLSGGALPAATEGFRYWTFAALLQLFHSLFAR